MSGGADTTDSLATALGRIPSGLFVLSVRHNEQETGMLASWVQQCSFDPPQVSVAVKKGRDVLDWLAEGGSFVLNILPEGAKALIGHFGKGFESGQPAFEGLEVARERETAPVLLASHAYLSCRVVLNHGHPTVHVRKNGLKY
jgi:flavin reductase (DIM6/NTAB) family NADH-FMN oxidoreductase RutF